MKTENTGGSTGPALMTVPETCWEMRCGRTKVYELIANGLLETVQIGSARRVIRASLLELIRRLSSEGA